MSIDMFFLDEQVNLPLTIYIFRQINSHCLRFDCSFSETVDA